MKRINQTSFLVLIGILAWSASFGQTYVFTHDTGAYKQLQNATLISNNFGSGQFWKVNYGFSMHYFERPYHFDGVNGLLISSDGYIASPEYIDSTDVTINAIVSQMKSRSENSGIFTKVEDQSGRRIIKLEWRNVGFSTGNSNDSINFQIWLYEDIGTIEMRFGPSSVSSSSAYGNYSGPSIGFYIFSLRQENIFQKLEGYFLSGDAKNPSFMKYLGSGSPRISGTPANGTIYRFKTSTTSSLNPSPINNPSIFPNPSSDKLFVNQEFEGYRIIDQTGRLVNDEDFQGSNTIDIAHLKPGYYILELELHNGEIARTRFLKE